MALEGERIQGVFHGLGDLLAAGELHEQLLALGALDGDGGPGVGDVGDGDIIFFRDGTEMGQVLVGVGGVDHQEEAILLVAVEIGVVHRAAPLVGDDAVLGLVQVERQDIGGEDVLEKLHPLGAGDEQTAHVGNVEQAAHAAGIQMLGHDAGGILDGHEPSSEIHHDGPFGHMGVVEGRSLQFTHEISASFFDSKCKKAQAPPFADGKGSLCLRFCPERFPGVHGLPRPGLHLRCTACAVLFGVSSRPGPFA